MSQFYARYIPPSTTKPPPSEAGSIKSKPSKTPHQPKKRKLEHSDDGQSILAKYSSTQAAQRDKDDTQRALNGNAHSFSEEVVAETAQQEDTLSKTTAEELEEGENPLSKHSKLLSRFEKSQQRTNQAATSDSHRAQQAPHEHVHAERQKQIRDLGPIPQPEITTPDTRAPTYATAPEWLRNPLRADFTARQDFKELGLSRAVQKNLASEGKKTALPVQSAVLPLLVNKEVEERPDLCVAAATGSGKTLAYVLPIVHALQKRRVRRLRAVIVVPTRALVKQVVHTLEYCSKGLDLKLGTAEGSKSIAEERRQLVEETLVYNPEEYRQQQEAPIDWGTFDHVAAIEQAEQESCFAHIGYIKSYSSKIDVLVCTPGRLIEHLQSTTGFNLDHVQWFVADEADRLLNESYHEWLETVLPALKSNAALVQRDQLLRYIYLDVPERRVTKILLSATMTSDISQILSMELHNPKLVVVESKRKAGNLQDDAVDMNEDAEYQMPPGLVESAIAFKDTENKPLYLLELLRVHIFTAAIQEQGHPGQSKENDVSNIDDPKVEADDHSSNVSDSSDDSDSSSSIRSSTSPVSHAASLSSLDSSGTSSDSASEAAPRRNRQPSPSTRTKVKPSPEPRVLIFTKSTESAHRLSRLLTLLSPSLGPSIATFTRSSTNTASNKSSKSLTRSRAKILQSFTSGTTRILISTDLAARGLDIPALEHVINYDVPTSALTYVHRVGRTARAGMNGHAWTLVEHRQGKWFWETIGGKSVKEGEKKAIGRDERVIQKVYLTVDGKVWGDKYEAALKKLGEDVRAL